MQSDCTKIGKTYLEEDIVESPFFSKTFLLSQYSIAKHSTIDKTRKRIGGFFRVLCFIFVVCCNEKWKIQDPWTCLRTCRITMKNNFFSQKYEYPYILDPYNFIFYWDWDCILWSTNILDCSAVGFDQKCWQLLTTDSTFL